MLFDTYRTMLTFYFQVQFARNAVMHSASMKLSQQDFQTHTNAMIDLLTDPLFICTDQKAQDASKAIKEVC